MIVNKHINRIIIILVVFALLFTGVFMMRPELLGLTASAASPLYMDKLFAADTINSIEIHADEEDWQEMLDNATQETYITCDMTINGETYYSVGIRPKGNSSLSTVASSDSDRYSFKIKMDKFVDGQTYYGISKFVVNNMQGDASYMKEYLSYDMFEFLGIETPAYAFTDISVNGEAWGFYLLVEAVEKEFASRSFGAGYGQLYKPESEDMGGGGGMKMIGGDQNTSEGGIRMPRGDWNTSEGGMQMPDGGDWNTSEGGMRMPGGGDWNTSEGGMQMPGGGDWSTSQGGMQMPRGDRNTSGGGMQMPGGGSGSGADLVYTDDEIDSYGQIFDQAVFNKTTDGDKKRVIAALKVLNESTDAKELAEAVDVDEVLRYFAVNTVLVNLDSYVGNFKHNYYLYEKDGQLSILPWDLNLSFAGFQTNNSTDAVNFPIDTPVMEGIALSERPLIGSLINIDEYKDLYHSYIQKLVDEYFNSGYFEEQIDHLDTLIRSHVENDATAFFTYEQYETAVDSLKEFGALRAESLAGQLAGTIPTTHDGQNADSDALVDASSINISDMGMQGRGGNR